MAWPQTLQYYAYLTIRSIGSGKVLNGVHQLDPAGRQHRLRPNLPRDQNHDEPQQHKVEGDDLLAQVCGLVSQANRDAGKKVSLKVYAHVYPSVGRGRDYAPWGGSGVDLLEVKKTDRFTLTQWIGFRVCGCQRTVGPGFNGASSVPGLLARLLFPTGSRCRLGRVKRQVHQI